MRRELNENSFERLSNEKYGNNDVFWELTLIRMDVDAERSNSNGVTQPKWPLIQCQVSILAVTQLPSVPSLQRAPLISHSCLTHTHTNRSLSLSPRKVSRVCLTLCLLLQTDPLCKLLYFIYLIKRWWNERTASNACDELSLDEMNTILCHEGIKTLNSNRYPVAFACSMANITIAHALIVPGLPGFTAPHTTKRKTRSSMQRSNFKKPLHSFRDSIRLTYCFLFFLSVVIFLWKKNWNFHFTFKFKFFIQQNVFVCAPMCLTTVKQITKRKIHASTDWIFPRFLPDSLLISE